MKLKCETCGTEKDFQSEREAFVDGWDFAPSSPVTTCGNCPSAPLLFKNKTVMPTAAATTTPTDSNYVQKQRSTT
jgi:hypothetical protein